MNWILVVLQYTAMTSGNYAIGWQHLGEFRTNEACIAASKQLVQSQKQIYATSTPRKFECVAKGGT